MKKEDLLTTILFDENGYIDPLDLCISILNEESYNSSIGPLFINVYGNEGPVPHFHIENPKDKGDVVCVGIFEAKYFSHQANVQPKTLDKKVLNALNKTMKAKYKKSQDPKYTNWHHIKDVWIQQNGIAEGYKDKYTETQPDYTKTSGEI